MAKIYAPNKQYNGVTATVRFIDGIGETENEELLEWFPKHGYSLQPLEDKPVADPDQQPDPGDKNPDPEGAGPQKGPGK